MPDFGRMFLMLKYTDITQNTYIQITFISRLMHKYTNLDVKIYVV
jgi:hypothetical protein